METIVLVIMILVCFNYILKQTYQKRPIVILIAMLCALIVGLMWPLAIEQSKSQISDWLANPKLMLDIAVILTIEVIIQITFCILYAYIHTSNKISRYAKWSYLFLKWFPGILIIPVLFSLLVSVIFAFPGISFPIIAWSLSIIILTTIPFGCWCLKRLLPEKEIRLELLFLTNALIAILGISATVNGQTAIAGISKVNWEALGSVCSLLIIGAVIGIITYRIKIKRITKKLTL